MKKLLKYMNNVIYYYKLGDINDAINCINRLISDNKLQDKLYVNGLKTAKKGIGIILKNK